MEKKLNYLVVIPARGGSKRIPKKNIKLLNNIPLIQYTIDAARNIFKDNVICVSTDDLEIIEFVESLGLKVPFIRPYEISNDSATSNDVLLHAVNYFKSKGYKPDVVILLQPTSPFRTSNHILEAIDLLDDACDSVFSVTKFDPNPLNLIFNENPNGFLKKNQFDTLSFNTEIKGYYKLNGAIYVYKSCLFDEFEVNEPSFTRKYLMSDYLSIDIDTEFDWAIAEGIINNYKIS